MQLNSQQQQVVNEINSSLIVLAGPGSGKTQVIARRTENILNKITGINHANILILTFTKAGVQAMQERLVKILGINGYDVTVATFHSFATSLLSENIELASKIKEKEQLEDTEKYKIIEYILKKAKDIADIRPFGAPLSYLGEIVRTIGKLKQEGWTPAKLQMALADKELSLDDFIIANKSKNNIKEQEKKLVAKFTQFVKVYDYYEKILDLNQEALPDEIQIKEVLNNHYLGRMDYDDIINLSTEFLEKDWDFKQSIAEQYQYIMVDEFQDTNGAQLKFLFALCDPVFTNLCVVGDDDQAIYRFQGANIANFTKVEDFFNGEINWISLEINYRSTAEIVAVGQQFINTIKATHRIAVKNLRAASKSVAGQIKAYQFKTLISEFEFIRDLVVDKISKGKNYQDIAVLMRDNGQVSALKNYFLEKGIPYQVDEKENLLQQKLVQDLLLIFKGLVNFTEKINDDAWLWQVLNLPFWNLAEKDLLYCFNSYTTRKNGLKNKILRRLAGEDDSNDYLQVFTNFFTFLKIKLFPQDPKLPMAQLDFCGNEIEDPKAKKEDYFELNKLYNLKNFQKIITVLESFSQRTNDLAVDFLLDFVNQAGIKDWILQNYDQQQVLKLKELKILAGLVNILRNQKEESNQAEGMFFTIKDWLDKIDLMKKYRLKMPLKDVASLDTGVFIATVHGAKGLEFDTVIIPGLNNKKWPSKNRGEWISIPAKFQDKSNQSGNLQELKNILEEDEKRIFFVAITRAKQNLIFSYNQEGKKQISKFLSLLELEIDYSLNPQTEEDLENIYSQSLEDKKEEEFNNFAQSLSELTSHNLKISASSLNNYITCPRKFFYQNVLQVPDSVNQNNVYGSAVHFALEKVYSDLMRAENNKLADFNQFLKHFKFYLKIKNAPVEINNYCLDAQKIKNLEKWYNVYTSIHQEKPHSLEKAGFAVLKKDLKITGFFDKIEYINKENKTVKVVDYKTGKPDNHIVLINHFLHPELGLKRKPIIEIDDDNFDSYLLQIVFYQLLFNRSSLYHQGFKMLEGELVFTEPLKKDIPKLGLKQWEYINVKIKVNKELENAVIEYINKVYTKIKVLEFLKLEKEDLKKCGNCNFRGLCWG